MTDDIEDPKWLDDPAVIELGKFYDQVRSVVKTLISVQKTHGMGTEYLMALLNTLGVKCSVEELKEASWHALCEWDL